ncbi:hypothetical protein WUBG_15627, partial [Wuchereria bancrofti]
LVVCKKWSVWVPLVLWLASWMFGRHKKLIQRSRNFKVISCESHFTNRARS